MRTTPFVGHAARLSRAVGDNDIALFTEISGDRNPLHYDEAAAKGCRFGEIGVQGGTTPRERSVPLQISTPCRAVRNVRARGVR
jgi:MaoC like domain